LRLSRLHSCFKSGLDMSAYFLGPKSENEAWLRSEIQATLDHWFAWRKSLFPDDPEAIPYEERLQPAYLEARERMSHALTKLNEQLKDETAKFSPRYIGHMVSELSLPGILGHFAALLHNPNNTSKEVSKVSTVIERQAIEMLAEMVGYDASAVAGHFTCGGTIANFEAIWRARFRMDHWLALALYLAEARGVRLRLFDAAHMGWTRYWALLEEHKVTEDSLRPYSGMASNPFEMADRISALNGTPYRGPVILVPGSKHFSWQKGTNIFGLGENSFWPVETDEAGHLDPGDLKTKIDLAEAQCRPVLMVVSVAGTTEAGEIDPIHKVTALLETLCTERGRHIWHHVDAAYGGFMCAVLHQGGSKWLSPESTKALRAISQADSITLDPHKLGYVPYACGAFLARDDEAYAVSSFKAPYLDRPDLGDGKWSTTIEGSRAGLGPAATWLTGKSMGFTSPAFADVIESTFEAARRVRDGLLQTYEWVQILEPTETNILCFSVGRKGQSLSQSNALTRRLTEFFADSPKFAVSQTDLGTDHMGAQIRCHVASYGGIIDTNHLTLVRCVFMNPFLAIPRIRDALLAEFLSELGGHYDSAINAKDCATIG